MNKYLVGTLAVVATAVAGMVGLSIYQLNKVNNLIEQIKDLALDHYNTIKNNEDFVVADYDEKADLVFVSMSSELNALIEDCPTAMNNILLQQARSICAGLVLGGL